MAAAAAEAVAAAAEEMAYRRSITSRVNLLTQRFHPSFSYVLHDDDGKRRQHPAGDASRTTNSNFLQRGYHNGNANSATSGFSALFQERRSVFFSVPSAIGSSYCSYSSSAIEEGSDKIEYMSDVAEVLSEKSMEIVASQAPIASEVAIAAQDSFFPVAALQYVIDGVHSFTGFNWWLSIALTTLMIRGATVPLLINQLKATQKLTLMRPQLEEIKQEMQDKAADPNSVYEGRQKMNKLFEEYGVTPFTPLKGLFVQGPVFISFFLGITNMVEKVPSFKVGGAFWFTDLTTPDTLYVLPVLTALSFLITVECNMQEGLEGNPIASTMKNFSRILAVLTVPFTMGFPKAIFCYWITSNLFSLCYGLVIKRPPVKKYLGIPEMQMPPPTSAPHGPQSPFSLFSASKPLPMPSEPVSTTEPIESVSKELPSKVSERRISSSSVISQRLRTLEKQVKARNTSKKK